MKAAGTLLPKPKPWFRGGAIAGDSSEGLGLGSVKILGNQAQVLTSGLRAGRQAVITAAPISANVQTAGRALSSVVVFS